MAHTRTQTKRILSVLMALMMIALSAPTMLTGAAENYGIYLTNPVTVGVGETVTIPYYTVPDSESLGFQINQLHHCSPRLQGKTFTVTGNSIGTDTFYITMSYNNETYRAEVIVNVTDNAPTTHTVTYNYSANGGTSANKTTATVAEGAAIDLTPTATKSGWTFVGWNTNSSATTALSSLTMGTSNVTLYAIYKKTVTATFIDYNGTTKTTRTKTGTFYNNETSVTITAPTQNNRTGWTARGWTYLTTPDAEAGSAFWLSQDYTLYGLYQRTVTLSYNANGGSSTPASQSGIQYVNSYDVNTIKYPTVKLANAISRSGYTFAGWAAGSVDGQRFDAGTNVDLYNNTTVYATWATQTHTVTYNYSTNGGTSATKTTATVAEGAAIDLTPTATKSGWTFVGWNTNSSATTALSSLTMGTSNVTLYAIFKQNVNIYNLGEETYSFKNYTDSHSNGHCFGMSITSAGYYLGKLNISQTIGISSSDRLYTAPYNQTVRDPICFYQRKQGSKAESAIVAGGSYYKNNYMREKCNISSDWSALINYVKGHSYDNKGSLQLIFWGYYYYKGTVNFGGHAVNFLYYKEVNGEQRIYVYDNNFPNEETYFCKASDGKIYQRPDQTLDKSIESMSLHDVARYYANVESFDSTKVIYANEGNISIDGAKVSPMVAVLNGTITYCYELPEDVGMVKIAPLTENAEFSYLDEEYSFSAVNSDTYGELSLSASEAGAIVGGSTFTIYNAPSDTPDPEPQSSGCPWCGGEHVGFFQGIIGWFHSILAMIFGARY